MFFLLKAVKAIDAITDQFGNIAKWAVLASCLISCANAVVRYTFDYSSNGFIEIQWYLFAVCVMFGAAQVFRVNEHVRVDVLYGRYSGKTQALIDIFGIVFFLLPVMVMMLYFSFPLFLKWYHSGEMSSNAGGLLRWPAMLTLPLGFFLLILQGLSELIKRVAWLQGKYDLDVHYERPLQ